MSTDCPSFKSADILGNIVSQSVAMQRLCEQLQVLSKSETAVLISGESGTGKEYAARVLHDWSARRDEPFIAVLLGALPLEKVEEELSGSGTLFLDGLEKMPEPCQVSLLSVLDRLNYLHVGGHRTPRVRARIVAAVQGDALRLVRQGCIRQDLYYRLSGLHIVVPPLRRRREDIPGLADEFLASFAALYRKRAERLTAEAAYLLQGYNWPGNVRELRSVMERAVLFSGAQEIAGEHLAHLLQSAGSQGPIELPPGTTLAAARRLLIQEALASCGGNKKLAALQLGISRRGLYSSLAEYHLDGPPPPRPPRRKRSR